MSAVELRDKLVAALTSCHAIKGIGQTGSLDAELIPGMSDIDLFVLCSEIPSATERKALYKSMSNTGFELQMEVCSGGEWGCGDILVADGVDVMPMYFSQEEMRGYLEEILGCAHLEKEGRFYPVGRVASIDNIHILYEKEDAWTSLKNMTGQKPIDFFRAWYKNEIGQVIDEEDLGRSELRREVLFFHQVLESALDHLLQALYALNRCYFPSRKRTIAAIEGFQRKPIDCSERLLCLVKDAAAEDSIVQAVRELRDITSEVRALGEAVFNAER